MWKHLLFAMILGAAGNTWAGPYDPIVGMAWVGESVPGQTSATIQLNLTTVKPVTLMSVTSPLAASVEIQILKPYKGKMKVYVLNTLRLPDHRTTIFPSQGYFLMMKELKQPLKTGDHVPITMTFLYPDKQSKTINADAEVREMELSYKQYGPNAVYDEH